MTDEQVAEIARSLTKAQVKSVVDAKAKGRVATSGEPCFFGISGRSGTIDCLVDAGLAFRWGKVSANLTEPLGLRVRALLLSEKNGG